MADKKDASFGKHYKNLKEDMWTVVQQRQSSSPIFSARRHRSYDHLIQYRRGLYPIRPQ